MKKAVILFVQIGSCINLMTEMSEFNPWAKVNQLIVFSSWKIHLVPAMPLSTQGPDVQRADNTFPQKNFLSSSLVSTKHTTLSSG